VFFFEKKNQKTLVCLAAVLLGGASGRTAESLFDLGVAVDNGRAARPDPAAAFVWYLRAAAAGSAAGAFNVGVMYDAGRGTLHDAAQAAFWYAVAASEGVGRGAYNLGELYASGEGVPRNQALAAAWFRRAAVLGIAVAGARARSLADGTRAQTASAAPPPAAGVRPMPVSADGASGVVLVWSVPQWSGAEHFFVEVAATAGGAARDVFTATTPLSALHVALPPGEYASRVFTIDAQAGRYTPGPWTSLRIP
jgi:hypothetical protein